MRSWDAGGLCRLRGNEVEDKHDCSRCVGRAMGYFTRSGGVYRSKTFPNGPATMS
jgi:hypothetical protein